MSDVRTGAALLYRPPLAAKRSIRATRCPVGTSLRRAGMKVRGVLPFPRTRDDRLSALPSVL